MMLVPAAKRGRVIEDLLPLLEKGAWSSTEVIRIYRTNRGSYLEQGFEFFRHGRFRVARRCTPWPQHDARGNREAYRHVKYFLKPCRKSNVYPVLPTRAGVLQGILLNGS